MTDIVERLRLDAEEWATPELVESLRMAAAEIERLRGTLRCQRCGASGDVYTLCAGCQRPPSRP